MFAPCWCYTSTPASRGGLTRDAHKERDALQAPDLRARASLVGTWHGVLCLGMYLRFEIFLGKCGKPKMPWLGSTSWQRVLLPTREGVGP